MQFREFLRGMKRHFKITNGVNDFIDTQFTTTDKVVLDIFKFDEWLHKQFGDYESEQRKSMKDIIEDEYGIFARRFTEKALGLLEIWRE